MAVALCLMFRAGGRFVKVEDLIASAGVKRCGDFSYLRHYGLIEKLIEKRKDGSPRNGYYAITDKGVMFCLGKIKVQEFFLISNNKLLGFDGDYISIKTALGVRFDCNELMADSKLQNIQL